MLGLGLFELLIIAAIILFFVKGGRKLPEIGEGIGKSITNFKKALRSHDSSKDDVKRLPKDQ